MPPASDGRPPRARPPDTAGEPWRFAQLLAAVHRLAFFTGAAMLAVTAAWWLVALAGVEAAAPVSWALAPRSAHALLMTLSYMPMFFAGFVFTAGPRWLKLPGVDARALVPMVALWFVGWIAFLAGAHLQSSLAAIGLSLVAASWSSFCGRFLGMLHASRVPERTHLAFIAGGCVVGAVALWSAATAIALDRTSLLHPIVPAVLWWFLATVFATAMQRMVPFFGVALPAVEERHPNALLYAWLALMALQPPFEWWIAASGGPVPVAVVVDAAGAAFVLWLLVRWQRTQNLHNRLLAMLFVAFAWVGVALAFQAMNAFVGADPSKPDFHLAAVHALAMGFFGSTMLAMVSRITCGQGGRMLSREYLVWKLFLVLQAAAVLRVASALHAGSPALLLAAALGWAIVMVVWSVRYIGWYGRPRPDGRAG